MYSAAPPSTNQPGSGPSAPVSAAVEAASRSAMSSFLNYPHAIS